VTIVERAVRLGLRNGWDRGILEGNSVWVVVGGVALLAYLAGRSLPRHPTTIFSEMLPPGEGIRIINEAPR
jgi:hypothetical protein